MNCPIERRDIGELLEFCARRLPAERAAWLEQHLSACSACRDFVAGQRAVWQALDRWEAPAVAPDFNRRLYQRIAAQTGWRDRWLTPFRALLVRQGLPIAAAACLIVVAGLVSDRPSPVAHSQPATVDNLQPEQVDHVFDDMQMLSDFTRVTRSEPGEL